MRTFSIMAVLVALTAVMPQSAEAAAKGSKFGLKFTFNNDSTKYPFDASFRTNGTLSLVGANGTFDYSYTELDLGVISIISASRDYTGGTEQLSGFSLISLIAVGSYSNTDGDTGKFSGFKKGAATREASGESSDGPITE